MRDAGRDVVRMVRLAVDECGGGVLAPVDRARGVLERVDRVPMAEAWRPIERGAIRVPCAALEMLDQYLASRVDHDALALDEHAKLVQRRVGVVLHRGAEHDAWAVPRVGEIGERLQRRIGDANGLADA